MLSQLRPQHLRTVRGIQVVLVLVATYVALSWAESEPAATPFASEHVFISYSAPVVDARGPWTEGQILTEATPGLPIGLAPEADITARYEVIGVEAHDLSWRARLRMSETDGEASWWSIEREIPLQVDGDAARMHLNLSAILAEAQGLEIAAHVPGRVLVVIEATHRATLALPQGDTATVRTASMTLTPAEGVVTVDIEGDEGAYYRPGASTIPVAAVAAALAALLLEVLVLRSRRLWAPWQRVPGLRPVVVKGLVAPSQASRCDLPTLLQSARRTRGALLVDPDARLAVLSGSVNLVADLPEPSAPAPEEPGEIDAPGRPQPAPAEGAPNLPPGQKEKATAAPPEIEEAAGYAAPEAEATEGTAKPEAEKNP